MTIGDGGAIWKRTGWVVTPKTAADVMKVLGRIGVYSTGQRFAWRGLSSADFYVESSLHRQLGHFAAESDMRRAEQEILTSARAWGLGVTESAHVDDLQLLADLQHYGLPTRLIDFTRNPMTALWFACQEAPLKNALTGHLLAKSGVVLALNITNWQRHATVGDPYATTWGRLEQGAGWTLAAALAKAEPFAVDQSVPNPRLRAQEGFFVAGSVPYPTFLRSLGTPFRSLEVPFTEGDPEELEKRLTEDRKRGGPKPLPFVAVIIGAGLKSKLLAYLDGSYNRRAQTLFPDYQGFRDFGLPKMAAVPMPDRHPLAAPTEDQPVQSTEVGPE